MKHLLYFCMVLLMFSCEHKKTEPQPKTKEQLRIEGEVEIIKALFIAEHKFALEGKDPNRKFNGKIIVFPDHTYSGKDVELDSIIFRNLRDTFENTYISLLPLARLKCRYRDSIAHTGYGAYDSITGFRGEIYIIGEIEWLSPVTVKVWHSYWYSPDQASGSSSMLTMKGGQWILIKTELEVIVLNRQIRFPEGRITIRAPAT
jgi:hypothetical protein